MTEKRRIIAYCMFDHEHAAALARLSDTMSTDSYVVGDGNDEAIRELEELGLVVRQLNSVPGVRTRSTPRIPIGGYAKLDLREPLCDSHGRKLAAVGLAITERLGALEFLASVNKGDAVANALQLPFVISVAAYDEPVREHGRRRVRGPLVPVSSEEHAYDVLLHAPDKLQEVKAFIAARGIRLIGASTRKLRVSATETQAEAINGIEGVSLVERYVEPKLYNERARALVWPGASDTGSLTGAGEVVAVADTGIDAKHPALVERVKKTFARGRPNDASDPHGHGTHVAGTIAGGAGPHPGIAPRASLVFQSVMDSEGRLSGLPLELGELFQEAYDAGARIHNDSWGADLAAAYTLSSLEVDRFVHENKEMLVVVAAGNAGVGARGVGTAKKGFVEWGSIGAPATSKNALVVGASRSDRTDGGLSGKTYAEVWGEEFPDEPIASQRVSGDPDCLAGFSSRGPCNDRRIKPDVVAPGTDVLSTKASTAPGSSFAGVTGETGAEYGYMSGTSMATPVVAGTAALVREWLRTQRKCSRPSAALLKALLINGTRWLPGPDATADFETLPNYHQGFGAVSLPLALPLNADFELAFVDNWQEAEHQLAISGSSRRFRVETTKEQELRVTLAYTDAPGRGIQNDLNVFVQLPTGKKRLGNESVPLAIFRPDPDNNVETLRIPNAPVGKYLIQVTATNILHGPQDFALVVTGALSAPELNALNVGGTQ